jgi:hypothetical protein
MHFPIASMFKICIKNGHALSFLWHIRKWHIRPCWRSNSIRFMRQPILFTKYVNYSQQTGPQAHSAENYDSLWITNCTGAEASGSGLIRSIKPTVLWNIRAHCRVHQTSPLLFRTKRMRSLTLPLQWRTPLLILNKTPTTCTIDLKS